jgi:predicted metal-binding protein
MINKKELQTIFERHSFTDFKWMNAKDMVIAHWVRFRCVFGCSSYGKSCMCPPNIPTIEECAKMLSEYNDVAVFHLEKQLASPEEIKSWRRDINLKMVKLEKDVFLSGYYKTLVVTFASCDLCESCSGTRSDCKNPQIARPTAEALGIDVYATVRNIGYPIQVLKDHSEAMNRYAFLLIE